jgi:hypothetical protein
MIIGCLAGAIIVGNWVCSRASEFTVQKPPGVEQASVQQYLAVTSRRDGREAEGTGLLNRHTWKRVSRVRIPLSPLRGSAQERRARFVFDETAIT